ncbi:unnamed protein product [Closterium sp. NIES-65]|nr:unnamed protein product [Closterium sp. NIES-65]
MLHHCNHAALASPCVYLALTLPLLSPPPASRVSSFALTRSRSLPSQALALSLARPLTRSPSYSLDLSLARVPLTRSRPSHSLAPLSLARPPLTRSRPSHSLAPLSLTRAPLTHSRPSHSLSPLSLTLVSSHPVPPLRAHSRPPCSLSSPLALVTTHSPSLALSLSHSRRPSLTLAPHAHSRALFHLYFSPCIPLSHFLAPSCPVDALCTLSPAYTFMCAFLSLFLFTCLFTVLTAANEEGPMTILIPLDVTEYYTSIKDYSAEEREKIMKYHMIPKQYKYKKLMKEKAGYKIKTKVDGQKISKMTGDKFPGIVLMGKKGMPSIMVGGDVFVGEELAIHLVTSMLIAPSFHTVP